jgi:hypothetical protein
MNFRKLDVCQAAVRFLPLAAAIADSLPPRYASLADQLRRSLADPIDLALSPSRTSMVEIGHET